MSVINQQFTKFSRLIFCIVTALIVYPRYSFCEESKIDVPEEITHKQCKSYINEF